MGEKKKQILRSAVILFLVTIVLLFTGCSTASEKQEKDITITTDEDAIAFADELRADFAPEKPELAQPFDGALVMTLDNEEMNALGLADPELPDANETFYLVSWETVSGNLVKVCSTAFTTTGAIALEPGCAVMEIVVEEDDTTNPKPQTTN